MDSRQILEQLYVPAPKRARKGGRLASIRLSVLTWVSHKSWRLAAVAVIFSVWAVAHVHYFNTLTELECEIHAAKAQILAQQQRRHHIRHALAGIVKGYTRYEERILTALTEMRAGTTSSPLGSGEDLGATRPLGTQSTDGLTLPAPLASGAAPNPPSSTGDLKELLTHLKVVGEQYPDLKLTQNLQQLSASVIESETEIAQRIMKYNEAVNSYTTIVDTFPGNIFGRLSHFRTYSFYEVDQEKLRYEEVSF